MCTNMHTLARPPSESCRSVVSLELRKGMWLDLLAYAAMTSPSAERLLLMCCASFSRAPVASERPTRSDPAKSTRLSMLDSLLPDRKCCAVTWMDTTEWDLEERSFMEVWPMARLDSPSCMVATTSRVSATGLATASGTYQLLTPAAFTDSRTSRFLEFPSGSRPVSESRSRTCSLYISSMVTVKVYSASLDRSLARANKSSSAR
mmetsp:Transcript_26814/g.51083  ORF Transcript_26814/g.51083 Transcript_26814/m.51083 type:complete len:205 (-) Transcript_26814:237-851(-)